MFRFGNLRTRLVVILLVLSVPPFAALGLLAIGHTRKALQRTVSDHLASLALKRGQAVSQWIRERKNDLGQMSDHCLLGEGHHRSQMAPWLYRVERTQPYYQGIFAVNQDGRVMFSTQPEFERRNHAQEEYFRRAMRGATYVSEPYWDEALGKPALMLAAPIPQEEKIVGVIVARVDLREIEKMVAATRPGRTGEAFVIDSRGRMITGSRFRPNGALRESISVPEPATVFAPGALVVREGLDYRNKQTLTAYSRSPEAGWTMVVKQDTSEAYAPVRRLEMYLVLGLIAGLVAVTAAAIYLARGISAPLTELVRSTSRIASGDLGYRAEVETRDEIGELSRAFNRMVERLERSQQALQRRQEELAAANRKLEALHAVDHQHIQSLHEITRAMSSTLDLDVVLQTLLQSVVSHLDAGYGAILLTEQAANPSDGSLRRVRAVHGSNNGDPGAGFEEFERRRARQVMQTRQPLLVRGARSEAAEPAPAGVSAAAMMPLTAGDECIGVIHVARMNEDDRPFDDDVRFLRAVAQQASVAIQNAQLYEAEQRHRRHLERAREQLDRLLAQVMTAQEHERQRVALELHDGPTQSLAAMLRGLELCEALLGGDSGLAADELRRLKQQTRASLSEMRRLINDLRPTLLDSLGFLPAVRQYCREFEADSGVATRVQVVGRERDLDTRRAVPMFRILQESLSNVRKHADARNAAVELTYLDGRLRMMVKDDGKGFVPPEAQDGLSDGLHFGLLGMQERADQLGGNLRLETAPDVGTVVAVEIPLQAIPATSRSRPAD